MSAPLPCGPPSLWPGNFPNCLDRVDVQQAVDGVDHLGDGRDRLDHAGLVVGVHDGDEHPLATPIEFLDPRLEPPQIDNPVRSYGDFLNLISREPPAAADGGVLDRAHQHTVEPATVARTLDGRAERQRVGLGSARGEHHVAGLGTDQRGDLLPRHLDQVAGRPALTMDRGRITDLIESRQHGGACHRAQRRRRVPIEIDAIRHDVTARMSRRSGHRFADKDMRLQNRQTLS